MAEIDNLLNKGLEAGYVGNAKRETVQRGAFKLEVSQFISPDGSIYRDEWIADRVGGGQEIAQSKEGKQTRLYAGGTIKHDELAKLGITKKDVEGKLKQFIKTSEGKTRLTEDYLPESDGDWQYSYKVIERVKGIPLTVGMETIAFSGKTVFAHAFALSPIE